MDINLGKLWEMVKQGSLACCSPWGCEESDMTWWLNNNKQKSSIWHILTVHWMLVYVGKCGISAWAWGVAEPCGCLWVSYYERVCLKLFTALCWGCSFWSGPGFLYQAGVIQMSAEVIERKLVPVSFLWPQEAQHPPLRCEFLRASLLMVSSWPEILPGWILALTHLPQGCSSPRAIPLGGTDLFCLISPPLWGLSMCTRLSAGIPLQESCSNNKILLSNNTIFFFTLRKKARL